MTTTRKHATKKSDDVRRPKDVRTSKVQNALEELQKGGASGHLDLCYLSWLSRYCILQTLTSICNAMLHCIDRAGPMVQPTCGSSRTSHAVQLPRARKFLLFSPFFLFFLARKFKQMELLNVCARLLNNHRPVHPRAAVRLAVVPVRARLRELGRHLLALISDIV